jgi:Tol biopolymer transport system component
MDPATETERRFDQQKVGAQRPPAPGSLGTGWDHVLTTPRGTRRARLTFSVALALLALLASVAAWQGFLHSAVAVRLGAMNEIVFAGSVNQPNTDASPVGAPQLYVIRPDGSGLQQVTHSAEGLYFSPVWSPDGTRIAAYTIDPANSAEVIAHLVVMNADGSHALGISSVLLDLTNFEQATGFLPESRLIFWSPDGSQLLAEVGAGRYALVNADGTRVRLFSAQNPTWSPDGRYLASYVSLSDSQQVSGEYTLALLDAQTLQARILTGLPGLNAEALAWSPDGRFLAVTAPWGVGNQLQTSDAVLLVRPDGTGLKVVAQWEGSQVQQIAWSPSSQQLAVVLQSFNFSQQGNAPLFDGSLLQVVNADGSQARQVGLSDGGQPSWSPDGTYLIYANPDDTKLLIADAHAQGKASSRSLVGSLMVLFAPCWSPLAGI